MHSEVALDSLCLCTVYTRLPYYSVNVMGPRSIVQRAASSSSRGTMRSMLDAPLGGSSEEAFGCRPESNWAGGTPDGPAVKDRVRLRVR